MQDDFVRLYLPDLQNYVRTISCLYTNTPDGGFIIDQHPDHPSVIIVSPCSGHGFKHSAAIGEAVAQLAVNGESTIDIGSFAFSRFR
jgi:sarcosine oxidase